jgi:hypothetical protein
MDKIKVGATIKDNDKRQKGRTFQIVSIWNDIHGKMYAVYQGNSRFCRLRFDRIHTDGGVHSDGWSLVADKSTL